MNKILHLSPGFVVYLVYGGQLEQTMRKEALEWRLECLGNKGLCRGYYFSVHIVE